MYSTARFAAPIPPPAPASANYPFLAKPPKHKHKPQPLTVRCVPPRTLPRPRRRASGSGSPASFLAFVDTPTPTTDAPKTPHLTTHGYAAAFSTLYQRRGSLPDTPRTPRRAPNSPKRSGATPRSAPSSPKRPNTSGSPKRRNHKVPSPTSPFAPPSPTRPQGRPRAKSTTRIPAPASTLVPPPRTPKLSKIRSFTNLRSRSPSPVPPSRATSPMSAATSTPKPTSKRAKRSATPARGSSAYAKYRPMPFIQQMQMIQFLEGGSMDSHIRRHHVHAGQGTAHTGFAVDPEMEVHGYAFRDEQGMVWFDEEEEWEFACLLPQARRRPKRGIKRLLGRRKEEESEEEWEDFVDADGEEQDEVDADALLAREDDELCAGEDDLAAFGGALDGAWGRDRPERSVLKLPGDRRTKKQRRRVQITPPTPAAPTPTTAPTTALKQEFLATAFAPSPARTSPSPVPSAAPVLPPTRATSPFRMFTHHRHARSVPSANPSANSSFASVGASLRGGAVLDTDVPPSPGMSMTFSRQPSPTPDAARLRSVSPPPAAARRLGIEPGTTSVSLQPPVPTKKPSFMNLRRRRD